MQHNYIPQELIRKKRDGGHLDEAEIDFLVRGLTDHKIGDAQIAAFAMAVFFNGMDKTEGIALTRAMTQSGDVLDWQHLNLSGPILDKHSTGGVGDKVSLMLAPIIAACGGFVPMISGRGLGHTGGTLDKMDSIAGYQTAPDPDLFRRTVKQVGCAIIGQTGNLAPADKRLYAIRDVTSTVESIPLITASILSKKLAAGLEGLVLDVKTGSGAFAATYDMARSLSLNIVEVAKGLGLQCSALITDMNQVLGHSAGNGVEVMEVIKYLQNTDQDPRLHECVVALCAAMLMQGKLASSLEQARNKVNKAISSGDAAQYFAKMVAALGGPVDVMERPDDYIASAPYIAPCFLDDAGIVNKIDVRKIGIAIIGLGGGRTDPQQKIDPRVGFTQLAGLNAALDSKTPLAIIHAADEGAWQRAAAALKSAYQIDPAAAKTDSAPIIMEQID
ncbi:MAG: thymidine phosphorylase [Alphaproteobacteria bacterium]